MLGSIAALFKPKDMWANMHPAVVSQLDLHLTASERTELTRLLRKHRKLQPQIFGKPLHPDRPAESLASRLALCTLSIREEDTLDALQLLACARQIDPESALCLAMTTKHLLHLGDTHHATLKAAKAYDALLQFRTTHDNQNHGPEGDLLDPLTLDHLIKQMRGIKEGRVHLGAYRTRLHPEQFETLSQILSHLHEDLPIYDHIEEDALPFHPATAIDIADEILQSLLGSHARSNMLSLGEYQMLSMASALDPDHGEIQINAALGLSQYAEFLKDTDPELAEQLARDASRHASAALQLLREGAPLTSIKRLPGPAGRAEAQDIFETLERIAHASLCRMCSTQA